MSKTIFVAGHEGMVGRAICNHIKSISDFNLLTAPRADLDLLSQNTVQEFLCNNNIDIVINAAARVGGINANDQFPAEFIYQNLQIQNNIINGSHVANIHKILFLGSSCIYPKLSSQPIREDALLSGKLEPTNEPYAIAKIAGIKMCESYNRQYGRDYRSVMPTNLYGPWDNFHPENSHVIPGLIFRFHNAKIRNDRVVKIWGTGSPMREFLYVDDMAQACIFILNLSEEEYRSAVYPMQSHINVGSGLDLSIAELAETIKKVIGFKGKIKFDPTFPDGSPRKLMNSDLLYGLGWKITTDLSSGIEKTYSWFLENQANLRSN